MISFFFNKQRRNQNSKGNFVIELLFEVDMAILE